MLSSLFRKQESLLSVGRDNNKLSVTDNSMEALQLPGYPRRSTWTRAIEKTFSTHLQQAVYGGMDPV